MWYRTGCKICIKRFKLRFFFLRELIFADRENFLKISKYENLAKFSCYTRYIFDATCTRYKLETSQPGFTGLHTRFWCFHDTSGCQNTQATIVLVRFVPVTSYHVEPVKQLSYCSEHSESSNCAYNHGGGCEWSMVFEGK